jgi:hypothetical protein
MHGKRELLFLIANLSPNRKNKLHMEHRISSMNQPPRAKVTIEGTKSQQSLEIVSGFIISVKSRRDLVSKDFEDVWQICSGDSAVGKTAELVDVSTKFFSKSGEF